MSIKTINPTTEGLIQEYPLMSSKQIESIITDCHQDFLHWSRSKIPTRTKLLKKISSLLILNKSQYAKLMAEEMGKPITSGEQEVEKCARLCDYYAENAENMLQPEIIQTNLSKSYVVFEPMGIVFAIMPWNFPFWQVFRFAIPNLVAGNACLLKHAAISTGTALAIEKVFQQAGFPPNIFRSLIIEADQVEKVIANPHVTGVTLTGSKHAGSAVARTAGEYLKKVVLELGGNDPYVILADANLDLAAEISISARLNNSGQVCIAAKRIIAEESIHDELLKKIQQQIEKYKVGDPLKRDTLIGPLARGDLRALVHDQVEKSVAEGAKLLLGGNIPQGRGFFYPPTLLMDVEPGMIAFDEEIFGPVVVITRAKNVAEAIKLANNSQYGLGAAIFTRDSAKGQEIATTELQAGTCAVNTYVRSDPKLPFGGIKNSGFGRELAEIGLKSFLNIKTIQVDTTNYS